MSKGLGPEREEKDPATLSELFDNAFELFNNINKTQEPTNSPKVQVSGIEKNLCFFRHPSERLFNIFHFFLHATRQKERNTFNFYVSQSFVVCFVTLGHLDSYLIVFVIVYHSLT